MHWIDRFADLRLDIVGIIAVLGEASITRNAQVTSLSWWSTIPRLLPAPQALLEHERKYRLPTADGIVAGAYSGMVKKEINFFAQLLHDKPLDDYQVELVQVTRKRPQVKNRNQGEGVEDEAEAEDRGRAKDGGKEQGGKDAEDGKGNRKAKEPKNPRSFGPKKYGPLFLVTLLGFAMSITLIGLSVHYHDGFSLLATIMLSVVSSCVGFGTHWSLVFKEPKIDDKRKGALPRSDVIIYYPNVSG